MKYPCAVVYDQEGNDLVYCSQVSPDIQFGGLLYRNLFPDQYYFAGKWEICDYSVGQINGNSDATFREGWKMWRQK